jgi:hypothetical protein
MSYVCDSLPFALPRRDLRLSAMSLLLEPAVRGMCVTREPDGGGTYFAPSVEIVQFNPVELEVSTRRCFWNRRTCTIPVSASRR